MSSSNQLPQARLVTTTHTKDGTSVFASDEQVIPFNPFGPSASSFSSFHSSPFVPVLNTGPPPELAKTLPRCPPSGVIFCTTDIPPKYRTPMHRTLSLDYVVVISGEIVLRLDGDEEKVIGAGEFIVQRGANHEWINRSEEPCRMMVVMVGSEKIVLDDGRELGETVFKKQV
ncbi:hypothetical protein Egran_00172 [Elaphomyces granulatus]|uniref:Cupin type-2 domain-containing protein n=1 Tax=Elaphomyces granulatus TaxID=519963 RepID=A0A232M6V0_9EURO|nr:hypothetical protein Egran_00172 [Elaphomyces granulatus]